MKNYRAVPIRSAKELEKHLCAGAKIQYTSCGGDYNAEPYSIGGWIDTSIPRGWFQRPGPVIGETTEFGERRLRAIYPITAQSRPSLWRRLFGRREAA